MDPKRPPYPANSHHSHPHPSGLPQLPLDPRAYGTTAHSHPYQQHPPPPPLPPHTQTQSQSQAHYPQPPPPPSHSHQQTTAGYSHNVPPAPPHIQQQRHHPPTTLPPSSGSAPPLQQQLVPPPRPPSQPPSHPYPSPQSAPPSSGPALPPMQQGYAAHPSIASQEQQSLPPFRHPPPQQQQGVVTHDLREPIEYRPAPYGSSSRRGHETPVNPSYSHDSIPHQQTPTTPVQAAPFPPPAGPESAPTSAHPVSMDHGPPHGYAPPNGVPHNMPPAQHDSHSQYMTPTMESHHSYPHSQSMYPPSYGPTNPLYGGGAPQSAKRKQMRASQACEQCRQRKQKCDEGTPCSFCKESSLPCVYRDAAPPKTDKNLEKLMTYIEANTDTLRQVAEKLESFDTRLQRIETRYQSSTAIVSASGAASRESGDSPGSSTELADEQQRSPKRRAGLDDHRTPPHKLVVLWPSIKPMFDKADIALKDSYVMEAEDRGVLRIYTRGEGIDEFDGTQLGGPASPARSEESGEMSAPSPLEGIWGTGFPLTPSSGDHKRQEFVSWGGMRPDNTLDLDVNTINGLYESFMKNIHVMHPFVDKTRLRRMFDNFIKLYASGVPRKGVAPFLTNGDDLERAPKRQRSNGPMSSYIPMPSVPYDGVVKGTERSPANAIVYLVMALGKICQHQDPLPAPVSDNRLSANTIITHQMSARGNSVSGSSSFSSKVKMSPSSSQHAVLPGSQPTPPPMDRSQSRSRRSSSDGYAQRNIDVLPGMGYFAKATEILGDQADGTDLVHAQMFLLAGLYKGQLARVKESMSWYCMAGRALRILLDRYKLFNEEYWTGRGDVQKRLQQGQKQIKDRRQNLILLASWTCLQLETDILADLPLPSSGIQEWESILLLPHKVVEDAEYTENFDPNGPEENYDRIMYYYTAQFWLRKRLNLIHRELYGPDALSQTVAQVSVMLRSHESMLTGWRDILTPELRWNDNDGPATNILDARLRAKYWGARYVVNRPFLDYALHIMPMVREGHTVEEAARDAYGNPRHKADIHLFEAIRTMEESEIWQACQRCIFAAMQSTIALDGVPGRLIVTGIHGTAHAQFGNMLVLATTYNSGYARELVDAERFQQLLIRTIRFLRRIPISKTCSVDCGILEKLQRHLFGVPLEDQHLYINEGVEYMRGYDTGIMSHNTSFSSAG